MPARNGDILDCLIVGGGPAGLTAALYLARFQRRFLVVDGGNPRAGWIPTSHNIPFFAEGIDGAEILARQREHVGRYDVGIRSGIVTRLEKTAGHFVATVDESGAETRIQARRVLLATGAVDVEPDLPDLADAIQRGLVRYCPICDGYEARNRRIAVIGQGDHGLGEAVFVARTYSDDVTLLTLGECLVLNPRQREQIAHHRIKVVEEPVVALDIRDERITAMQIGDGAEYRFEVLYSALGLRYRTGLALSLGARHDASGALIVDEHNQTTVKGLYAAGAIVRGLDQIVVAMGHASIAATHIHNRCELPTEDESDGTGAG
jgi:thioredoxin reductase (NADPH)